MALICSPQIAEDAEMNVNEMTEQMIGGAIEVHRNFKVI